MNDGSSLPREESTHDGEDGAPVDAPSKSNSQYQSGYDAISAAAGNEAMEALKNFLEPPATAAGEESSAVSEYCIFPSSEDKNIRTSLHQIIREFFGKILVSDTIDDTKGGAGKCKPFSMKKSFILCV